MGVIFQSSGVRKSCKCVHANALQAITIYTRRLGPIIVPDLKERNAHCFTSFMVIGPEVYRTVS